MMIPNKVCVCTCVCTCVGALTMEKRFYGQKEDTVCETDLSSKIIHFLEERERTILPKRDALFFKEIFVGIC